MRSEVMAGSTILEDPAIAARFRLPVSGIQVALRHPTGIDDVMIAEADIEDPALVLAIAQRLGRAESEIDWAVLTPSDFDALILRLRQALYGNRIVAEATCRAPACRSPIDISFAIEAYLLHHRPRVAPLRRRGWTVESCAEELGWFHLSLRGQPPPACFRLPTAADQASVFGRADAEEALVRLCIRPPELPVRLRGRIETAMVALAPQLDSDLQGVCPDCGTTITVRFEARRYCLQEMRDRARSVYDDIDALAQRYHWSEHAILSMPNVRRASYAELARQAHWV
jgi:hypothetical protein